MGAPLPPWTRAGSTSITYMFFLKLHEFATASGAHRIYIVGTSCWSCVLGGRTTCVTDNSHDSKATRAGWTCCTKERLGCGLHSSDAGALYVGKTHTIHPQHNSLELNNDLHYVFCQELHVCRKQAPGAKPGEAHQLPQASGTEFMLTSRSCVSSAGGLRLHRSYAPLRDRHKLTRSHPIHSHWPGPLGSHTDIKRSRC
jgi:hypothetical protein